MEMGNLWQKPFSIRKLFVLKLQLWHCAFVALIVLMMARCRLRSSEWTTEERLYKAGLRVCPNNAKVSG